MIRDKSNIKKYQWNVILNERNQRSNNFLWYISYEINLIMWLILTCSQTCANFTGSSSLQDLEELYQVELWPNRDCITIIRTRLGLMLRLDSYICIGEGFFYFNSKNFLKIFPWALDSVRSAVRSTMPVVWYRSTKYIILNSRFDTRLICIFL